MAELDNTTKLEISYRDGKVEKIHVESWEIDEYILRYWVESFDFESEVISRITIIPLREISKIKEIP